MKIFDYKKNYDNFYSMFPICDRKEVTNFAMSLPYRTFRSLWFRTSQKIYFFATLSYIQCSVRNFLIKKTPFTPAHLFYVFFPSYFRRRVWMEFSFNDSVKVPFIYYVSTCIAQNRNLFFFVKTISFTF